MRIERIYWAGGRMGEVAFHREVLIRRDDGLVVSLKPWADGSCRVVAAGVMNRCRQDFATIGEGLRYAVKLAKADAAIWLKGEKSRNASAAFMEGLANV